MSNCNTTNISKLLDDGLFPEVEEFRQLLEQEGWYSVEGLLTIQVFFMVRGSGGELFKPTEADEELVEAKLMRKYELTGDELITLKLIKKGLTNREICDELDMSISENGVAKRVSKILQKMEVKNRRKAAEKAAEEGL